MFLLRNGWTNVIVSMYFELFTVMRKVSTRIGAREQKIVPNKGLRLDYFVVPSKMISDERIHDCFVLDQGFGGGNTAESRTPSDHCPIVCVLKSLACSFCLRVIHNFY